MASQPWPSKYFFLFQLSCCRYTSLPLFLLSLYLMGFWNPSLHYTISTSWNSTYSLRFVTTATCTLKTLAWDFQLIYKCLLLHPYSATSPKNKKPGQEYLDGLTGDLKSSLFLPLGSNRWRWSQLLQKPGINQRTWTGLSPVTDKGGRSSLPFFVLRTNLLHKSENTWVWTWKRH